ncbi:MAG: glycosyltransferase family 4 protein [Bacteriovoracia bacterium]
MSTTRKRTVKIDMQATVKSLQERLSCAVVCLSHSWGGLEQVAAADALELGKQGLKVKVVCLEGSPIHLHLARRDELTVHPLTFRPRDTFDFKLRGEIHRWISENGVNLIHTHQTTLLGSISPWLWNHRNVALVATRHIMNSHDKRNLFHSLIYRRVDCLVVMSQVLRDNVLQTHRLRERQVKVIHLGIDLDAFDPEKIDASAQRAEWGADDGTVVIGLVGRIDPAKGQETFIKAAAGLLKNPGKHKGKFKFVIVGEETLGSELEYTQELQKIVEQFRIQDHVVFAGYKENIPEVMSAFDIFVMPSRQEAFGLVAIEAMAMECPIVISRGGSASEIVGDEDYGLLIRPDDAFDLQRQIRYLLDHPRERTQMGKQGRQHIRKSYDRRVRLLRTLTLYERMLRLRGI